MRPPQETASHVSLVPSLGRPELVDAGLQRALAAVGHAGRAHTDELHDAVCRYARQARQRDVGAREAATQLCAYARTPLAPLPAVMRREVEHQMAWWVAQEYHRDD